MNGAIKSRFDAEIAIENIKHISVIFGWIEQARELSQNVKNLIDFHDQGKELCKRREIFPLDWTDAESSALVNLAGIQEHCVRDLIKASEPKEVAHG